jgi:hypothetical protein
MTAFRTVLLVAAFALLPARATDMTDPCLDISGGGSVARQFDGLATGPDGATCNKKACRASAGGATFDCDTCAYYCAKDRPKWGGTKVKGKCTRTHPNRGDGSLMTEVTQRS